MDSRTDIEREAAEAVSILYLETLQRAKSAEEAAEEARRQRDEQHSRAERAVQEESTRKHMLTMQAAGIESRDHKIEVLEEERDSFREAANRVVEQEIELRRSLWQERTTTRRLGAELHEARSERARLRGALLALSQEVDDVLGA